MEVTIRQEKPADYNDVFEVIKASFLNESNSDHQEQFLVNRIRKSYAFVPELSLVAEVDKKIVGYIMLSEITIQNNKNKFPALALAPVAVLPEMQHNGIGSKLLQSAHDKAKELEYELVLVLGHEEYYPRFDYEPAINFDIQAPFEVPKKNFMLKELVPDAAKHIFGIVVYPEEFHI
ncbi:GNAT family N-acetyltransferase [Zunongwangia endophytica]|uniref:GNAT family N-acetyltransferase n=1 Tax=Zunongwangia endophytica TaxID=1808945 RepID=A0ABV8HFE7_9FLAO|nr:N-acetyltransferase [Zunongwangia endophytica]MDN3594157.1 N-acetyltransferase [Zunongwangia endophytica]